MARSPLLQLSDVTVSFGQEGLIDAVSLVIHAGDRLALVGRDLPQPAHPSPQCPHPLRSSGTAIAAAP